MSHESAIANLAAKIKIRSLSLEPSDVVRDMINESDRSAMILAASIVEHRLQDALNSRLDGDINRDERKRLFDFEGPLGSFASKIKMTHGLGIISRDLMRKIETIKAVRNAAAHCVAPTTFDDPAIRNAVAQLLITENRKAVASWDRQAYRDAYIILCTIITTMIESPEEYAAVSAEISKAVTDRCEKRRTSPDTPPSTILRTLLQRD